MSLGITRAAARSTGPIAATVAVGVLLDTFVVRAAGQRDLVLPPAAG
ncbi:MAG TPA: hypothetical protein VHR65_01925 [Solirubrobacterales bacterium]|nr:hypothetical protein [Solirubrobacterales bacterium]